MSKEKETANHPNKKNTIREEKYSYISTHIPCSVPMSQRRAPYTYTANGLMVTYVHDIEHYTTIE